MQASALIQQLLGNTGVYLQLLRFVIIMLLGGIIVRLVLMPLVAFLTRKQGQGKKTAHTVRNVVGVVGLFIALAVALQAASFGGIVTLLGAITAGLTVAIGFGIRDQIANLLAGLFIKLDPPFLQDDYIRVNEVEGRVQEIKLRETEIKTPTGEKLVVPNNYLSNNPLRNSTLDITTKQSITLSFKPDVVDKAIEILETILREHDDVKKKPEPQVYRKEVEDGKVVLQAVYGVYERADILQIKNEIIDAFTKQGQEAGVFAKEEDTLKT